jgi:hypothetical protein
MPFISEKRREWRVDYFKTFFERDPFMWAGFDIVDMAKDAVDTVKPYKSKTHLFRDLVQPFRGLWNTLLSPFFLGLLVPAVIILGIVNVVGLFYKGEAKKALNALKEAAYRIAGYTVLSLTKALRGLTQLAATPLTWLRATCRGIYAAVKGWQKFTENAGVQRLLTQAVATIEKNEPGSLRRTLTILARLRDKLYTAGVNGQPVNVDGFDALYYNVPYKFKDLPDNLTDPDADTIYVKYGVDNDNNSFIDYVTYNTPRENGNTPYSQKKTLPQRISPICLLNGTAPATLTLDEITGNRLIYQTIIVSALSNGMIKNSVELSRQCLVQQLTREAEASNNDNNPQNDSSQNSISVGAQDTAKKHFRLFGAKFSGDPTQTESNDSTNTHRAP